MNIEPKIKIIHERHATVKLHGEQVETIIIAAAAKAAGIDQIDNQLFQWDQDNGCTVILIQDLSPPIQVEDLPAATEVIEPLEDIAPAAEAAPDDPGFGEDHGAAESNDPPCDQSPAADDVEMVFPVQPEPPAAPEVIEPPGPNFDLLSDAMSKHLQGLPEHDGWTLRDDLQMIDFALIGLGSEDIAANMGKSANFVRLRFDELVGKQRPGGPAKYQRAQITAALTALFPKQNKKKGR